ncbi:hypothetical protein ACVW06_000646 [Pantoea ananatis]|nr:Uncharacterized protein BN1183_CJ_00310 [Pantoea ananatis]
MTTDPQALLRQAWFDHFQPGCALRIVFYRILVSKLTHKMIVFHQVKKSI